MADLTGDNVSLPTSPIVDDVAVAEAIGREVDFLRSTRELGSNERQLKLFDYLVAASLEGRSPKEAEISAAVFGDTTDTGGGSATRVYVFRLRKRLNEIYEHKGKHRTTRLTIPRGDYRLAVEGSANSAPVLAANGDDAADEVQDKPRKRLWPYMAVAAALAVVTLNIGLWINWASQPKPEDRFASSPLWADMTIDDGPLLIVVGDYYMFGEYEDQITLKRLIRDPSINSKSDLINEYLHNHKQYDRYADVATRYLPASTGFALADLAPLIDKRSNVQVKMASELTPNDLKGSDIIYVGLLNGLGPLQERVFAQSRYAIDGTYNEFIDRKSGETYVSEALFAAPTDTMYRDYGFVSSFKGVSGNRILIITGAQDTALIGMATSLTNPAALKALDAASQGASDLEALFEVKGQRMVDLQTQLLGWSAVDSAKVWTVPPVATSSNE